MKSKLILFIAIAVIIIGFGVFFFLTYGNDLFPVLGEGKDSKIYLSNVDELENECFYVLKSNGNNDFDINTYNSPNAYMLCSSFDKNWDKRNDSSNHVIWTDSNNDVNIPTLTDNDKLLFVSSTDVPFEGIEWERFGDYGYSIGAVNFDSNESGHYYLNVNDNITQYIYDKSDAAELLQFDYVDELFLDKLGDLPVREDSISDGGTIANLDKDGSYICEWYTGTYYQDFKMIANIHPFCSLERFTTYDFEFLHSNCIEITIPDWLKTGYYYVNDIGFFRYVKGEDIKKYNGKPYDAAISWNDRIIIKDEDGNVLYDPSRNFVSPDIKDSGLYTDEVLDDDNKSQINPYLPDYNDSDENYFDSQNDTSGQDYENKDDYMSDVGDDTMFDDEYIVQN